MSLQRPASERPQWVRLGDSEVIVDEWGEILATRATRPDLERAEDNLRRAVRRAKQAVEDYVVFNGLTKMWTFTYAVKCFDRQEVVRDVHGFVKRWRAYEGGRPFPYVWVIEKHKDGSYHVHFAVRGDHYTDFFALKRLWGKGRIRFDAQRKSRDGSRRSLVRLARYLTKYLAKDFGDELDAGSHRYEVAQGFQPRTWTRRFATKVEAEAWVLEMAPGMREVWCSLDDPTWEHSFPVWSYRAP